MSRRPGAGRPPRRATSPRAPGRPRARSTGPRAGAPAAAPGATSYRVAQRPGGQDAVQRQQELRVLRPDVDRDAHRRRDDARDREHPRQAVERPRPRRRGRRTRDHGATTPTAGWFESSVPTRWTDESSRPHGQHEAAARPGQHTAGAATGGRVHDEQAHRPAAATIAAIVSHWPPAGTRRFYGAVRGRSAVRCDAPETMSRPAAAITVEYLPSLNCQRSRPVIGSKAVRRPCPRASARGRRRTRSRPMTTRRRERPVGQLVRPQQRPGARVQGRERAVVAGA